MTKEEFRALETAYNAESDAREKYELATVLRDQVSQYYDQGGPLEVDVTKIGKALVMEMLEWSVQGCLNGWTEASVALQSELNKYGVAAPWNISVRLAPNLTDGVAAANNSKASVQIDQNVVTIATNVDDLEESTSSNPAQGTHKWIGLGIGTGLSSVDLATYNGSQLTVEDGAEAASVGLDQDGEFVLYIRADEVAETPKVIRLGSDGLPDVTLAIIIVQPEN